MLRAVCASVLFVVLFLAGCGTDEAALGPPDGWETDGTERWWRAGVDTSVAFRSLDSLATMGVLSEAGPVHRNVQRRLVPLYRNHPEIVDSLFEALIVPQIEEGAAEDREQFMREASRRLTRLFQYARPLSEQPEAAAVVYPDSLRNAGVGGEVRMQVYVSAEGETLAIELLEGVHPTLDALAMRATALKEWRPAYLEGRGVASWVRSVIGFNPPE